MKLRIATYNIHKGVSAFGRKARIHGIKEAIDKLDADLVFLQEVQGQHDLHAENHTLWPQEGQHDFLAGQSHEAVYGMNAVYEHGHHGNALLSRYPITSFTNHDVSDHAYEQRGILHAVVQIDKVQVHCFVIHLGLFAGSRRRQIQTLIKNIRQDLPANAPLVIAGDFNDWSQRLSQTLYQELGVIEAFDVEARGPASRFSLKGMRKILNRDTSGHARTFPAGLPWLCLDRVYLRGFKVNEAHVMKGAPWTSLSDHVPITASLELLDQAAST